MHKEINKTGLISRSASVAKIRIVELTMFSAYLGLLIKSLRASWNPCLVIVSISKSLPIPLRTRKLMLVYWSANMGTPRTGTPENAASIELAQPPCIIMAFMFGCAENT